MAISYLPGAERAAKAGLRDLNRADSQSLMHFQLNLLLARLKHFEGNVDGSMDYLLTLMDHPLNVPENFENEYLPFVGDTPEYPPEEYEKGREGYVLLEFTVDEQGFVQNPIIADSKGGKAFEEASLSKIENFRFIPKGENGVPVKTEGVQQLFKFELLFPEREETDYIAAEFPDEFIGRRGIYNDSYQSSSGWSDVGTSAASVQPVMNINTSAGSSRTYAPVQ
jgi:TonB family protein